jgi:hypothetical protein
MKFADLVRTWLKWVAGARAAVPALEKARHDAEESVRDEAEKALIAIAPSGSTGFDQGAGL